MAMGIPQGPGAALKFLTDEPSTCFTPNFESARMSSDAEGAFRCDGKLFSTPQTIDFEMSECESVGMTQTEPAETSI